MRRSTIVVAFLVATVASAQAAPASERLARGASAHSKSQTTKISSAAVVAKSEQPVNASKRPWVPQNQLNPGRTASAAAFTSARTANAAPVEAAAPAAVAPKRQASRKVARASAKREFRRVASRRLHAKTRTVSLEREIETPAITGSVDRSSSASAPTGSIPSLVSQMARQAGVNPALAHAVVKVESTYKPNVTGKGGYIGLMQLSYQTAKGMGFRGSRQALYEPRNNLTYGMKYLAGAVAKSGGNTCAAVSKYQGGHAVRGVTRAGAVYCAKVKRFMAQGIPASGRASADVADAAPKS